MDFVVYHGAYELATWMTVTRLADGVLNTIGYVLSRYGALTGQDLENLTHSEGPWRLADSGRRPGESARIKLEWIKQ